MDNKPINPSKSFSRDHDHHPEYYAKPFQVPLGDINGLVHGLAKSQQQKQQRCCLPVSSSLALLTFDHRAR